MGLSPVLCRVFISLAVPVLYRLFISLAFPVLYRLFISLAVLIIISVSVYCNILFVLLFIYEALTACISLDNSKGQCRSPISWVTTLMLHRDCNINSGTLFNMEASCLYISWVTSSTKSCSIKSEGLWHKQTVI